MIITAHEFNQYSATVNTDKGTPGHGYGHIYAPILNDLSQRRQPNMFEIGVGAGGSIKLFEYFLPRADILCLDIDPMTLALESKRTTIIQGNQSDSALLLKICDDHGPFHLVIDDGGHSPYQQMGSFHVLWPHMMNGGYYVIEDLNQSMNARRPPAAYFAEMALNLADQTIGKQPYSVTFGGQIVVIQKDPSFANQSETPGFPLVTDPPTA